jgi:type IV secretory pathway ATPase VirB11/archaellum biosynthesis ATPase
MKDLLSKTLRETPKHIVLGEVRGEEAYAMLEAMLQVNKHVHQPSMDVVNGLYSKKDSTKI